MDKEELLEIKKRIEKEFLPFVRRPSRYIGGEINQRRKEPTEVELSVALCFPDTYEVGMSNTGFGIIYEILNNIDGTSAERVFAPWLDAEEVMRNNAIPLFSLENKLPLNTFDIIGFSLSTELCYTNILNMLDLGGLKIRSKERPESAPIIIAGGLQASAAEPISEFIDLFVLGDGEQAVVELADFIKRQKKSGKRKTVILREIAKQFPWAYVPSLYKFEYQDGRIKTFEPVSSDLPSRFQPAVVENFEEATVPGRPVIPFRQLVHERISIEVMRGCPGRCRFCQASFCRRPIRYRSVDKILNLAKECYKNTGFETVGLLSLSTAEYPKLEELISKLNEYFKDKYVGVSVPSLRVDRQLKLLPKLVKSVRKGGLTIAVEAASEKLREIINKPLKDSDLFAAVEAAYQAGWQRLKLYFMVGLPGEKQENIRQIAKLCYELGKIRKKIDGKTGQINITISWFVPKPHTPFAWVEQKSKSYFEEAKKIIVEEKNKMKAGFLWFKFHNPARSILESAIGRGNRSLGDVIEQAWHDGARFDLWDDCFDYELWKNAFDKFSMDLETKARSEFYPEQRLPWEHLGGPDKNYLLSHWEQARGRL